MTESATPAALAHAVAVVTGAGRTSGRSIAQELGAAGATVYVTDEAGLQDELEQTLATVQQAGGRAIAIAADPADEGQVQALMARVLHAHGRIDVLANDAWDWQQPAAADADLPFWQQPLAHWDAALQQGLRPQLLASRHAAAAMAARGAGLIVNTCVHASGPPLRGQLFQDLASAVVLRMVLALAEDLRPHGVAAIALAPGWMRTDAVLRAHATDEAHWTEQRALRRSESPRYLGRAVAALAADPDLLQWSGQLLQVAELAQRYGFTDVDGRQPPSFTRD